MTAKGPAVHWRQVIEQYGCTRCGAAPGEPCLSDSGRPPGQPHADRSHRAAADGWTLHEEPAPEPRPGEHGGLRHVCSPACPGWEVHTT